MKVMNSVLEMPEHETNAAVNSNLGQMTVTCPATEQRRGSTPALMVGGGHKKLCRVVHGQRVVLGTTPPVFVAELRPSASSELLSSLQTPPKSRSPLNVEVDEAPLSNSMVCVKLLEAQDSDPCYTSGSEHSALSRNTSEASETLSQECAYSPTLTTTTASGCAVDIFSNSRSLGNAVSSSTSYEFGSDFSKLTLQDSGYSGSFPLCATNSDASATLAQTPTSQLQTPAFDAISPDYYASLLEFTLKLGYNEAQLKSVLCKLASTSPGQDKVLAELIKLGQDVQEMPTSADVGTGAGGAVQHGTTAPTFATGVQQWTPAGGLRSIVVDGSNVAMTHGNKVVFSCLGVRLCVEWFRRRGHSDIKVFVPQFRKEQSRSDNPITDQHILFDLEKENVLVWTPSRRLGGRRIICHDDRYILKTAVDKDAVIVSNDEYRDMIYENPDFRKAVEERLLMYNFIDGKFVLPDDPLGRYGPKLDQFLSKSAPNSSAPPCPYGRKCTYGNKCKFYHPERPGGLHRSVTERLRDHAEMHRRISPTNSLQHARLGATDSFGDLSSYPTKNENVGQKSMAFRTQSLNPATLLRQNSSNSTSPGRYSPPSYHNQLSVQSPIGPPTIDQRKYQHCDARVQRLQADSNHAGLSKQMSNPEAARNNFLGQNPVTASMSDDARYLMPPGPPNSFLRQIWQNEQQQQQQQQNQHHHGGHLHPHQPVVRNMSAPGVNLLQRHQAQFSYAPPTNNSMYIGNLNAYDHQRKNSVSDSQLNLLGVAATTSIENDDAFYPLSPAFGGSNYFIPSTTVWGPVEHSSSPVFTSPATTGWASSSTSSPPLPSVGGKKSTNSPPPPNLETTRSKVYYHLSQLFPEELVSSVMRANPNENDPQKLCSLILTAREQRRGGDEHNAKFVER